MKEYRLQVPLDGYRVLAKDTRLPDDVEGPVDLILSTEDKQTYGNNTVRLSVFPCSVDTGMDALIKDPRVNSIRLETPDSWSLISYVQDDEKPYDYSEFIRKLVIDAETLGGIFSATGRFRRTQIAGKLMVNLFMVCLREGTEEKKKVFSDWVLSNLRYTKTALYSTAALHPWLCEKGLVKASTYEDILGSVEPGERAFLISYAQNNGLLGKLEKLKDQRSRRPLSLEAARKLWTVHDKGDHYNIEWKHEECAICVIPDRIGSKPVGTARITHYRNEPDMQSIVLPAGVRLVHSDLHPADFRNFSDTLYPMDWEAAGKPECYEIPADKKIISEFTFAGENSVLKELSGLDHVTEIERSAFSGCRFGSDFLEIPKSVVRVGEYAFIGSSIKTFKLNDELEKIGVRAFSGAESIFCSPTMAARLAGT